MDEDTRDLIRQLCTRAGMIMEDASAMAILAPQEEHLPNLRRAVEHAEMLLAAANALSRN
jgi:hypothetical protein